MLEKNIVREHTKQHKSNGAILLLNDHSDLTFADQSTLARRQVHSPDSAVHLDSP